MALRGWRAERLAGAARSDDQRLPGDGGQLELMGTRFARVRSFAPRVLGTLIFAASVSPSEVLHAVSLLPGHEDEGRRYVPDDAPSSPFRPAGGPGSTPPGPPVTRTASSTTGRCAWAPLDNPRRPDTCIWSTNPGRHLPRPAAGRSCPAYYLGRPAQVRIDALHRRWRPARPGAPERRPPKDFV